MNVPDFESWSKDVTERHSGSGLSSRTKRLGVSSNPNGWRQMAAHPEPASVAQLSFVKGFLGRGLKVCFSTGSVLVSTEVILLT